MTTVTIFTILIIVAAIALILVVLVQKSKGGGLSSAFSSTNNILGYKKTTDGIEKLTWILAGIIMVLCIVTVIVTPKKQAIQSAIKPLEMPSSTTAPDMSTGSEIPTIPVTTDAPAE